MSSAKKPPSELWCIHNRRYDLTEFLALHPGGSSALALGKGRNCTELFESYHSLSSSHRPFKILDQFFTGSCAQPGDPDYRSSNDIYQWQHTPFYDEVKKRVQAHFVGRTHKATFSKWVHILFGVIGTLWALKKFFQLHWSSIILLPIMYWIGPSSLMHDGGHFSLCQSSLLNWTFGCLGSAHMSPTSWAVQHTIGHHCDTNIPNADPDLYHFSFLSLEGVPGFRTSVWSRPVLCCKWWVGVLFRICFTTIGPSFGWDLLGFIAFSRSFLGVVPLGPLLSVPWRLVLHLVSRLLIALVLFGFPLLVTLFEIKVTVGLTIPYLIDFSSAFLKGLIFALGPYAIHGIIFYAFSQVSHIQSVCHAHLLPIPKESMTTATKTKVETDQCSNTQTIASRGTEQAMDFKPEWAIHQILSTLDYAHDSLLWLHLSNGLNHQIAHHLFPQIDWIHYPEISPIIAATAREFGIDYCSRVIPTYNQIFKLHLAYLKELGEQQCFHLPPLRRAHVSHLKILGEPSIR